MTTGQGALRTTWSETDPRSARLTPPRPRMSMRSSAPVIASNPVASTIASKSYSAFAVRMPVGVISAIGALRISTKVTLSRLNVA